MGAAHIQGAGLVQSGTAGSLFIESAPHVGWLQTASLSGYTDSAASATTMATGHKTINGRIGQDIHGDDLDGLVDIARLRGLSIGVVTTDTLTGATPTAFLTHSPTRYDVEAIVAGLAAEPPHVMLGGGAYNLLTAMTETDAEVVRTVDELAAAPIDLTRPLAGLFSDHELPFIADTPTGDPTPRLPVLVSTALDHLLTDPDGMLLIVEGARIDHASHANRTDFVFQEVLELDQTVQQTVERLSALEDRAVTVVVTADHECGGLTITDPTIDTETGLPGVTWTWFDHTNWDVPVFAWGEATSLLDGERKHNAWAWATLDGALRSRAPVEPSLPRLPDGALDDLGPALVTQTATTDFGAGFNQLDGLRVTADARGLWVGIDGVFDKRANGVIVWLDLDPGAGTGVGAGMELTDIIGILDRLIGAPTITTDIDGLGFDAAIGQMAASYARDGSTYEVAGVRQFQPPEGQADNLAWKQGAINYDDGNVADGAPATDAGATGESINGMEIFVPYSQLWTDGLPADGASVSLMVTMSSIDGTTWSNQALPPQDVGGVAGAVEVSSVVNLTIDADGQILDGPSLVP